MIESFDPLAFWDRPEINSLLFYPRKDWGAPLPPGVEEHLFPVAPGIDIGVRFHLSEPTKPLLAFFHGNGEIASDYDEAGGVFQKMGLSLLAFDYRGYGKSSGSPTVRTLLSDALTVFDQVFDWILGKGYTGPLIVMGRSLGSAPALEIAFRRLEGISGLIIESGFAGARPLLELMGLGSLIPAGPIGEGFDNAAKIEKVNKPTLIIHAEHDQLIPLQQAQRLLEHSGAEDKDLIVVPGAGHNDILYRWGMEYFRTIARFAAKLKAIPVVSVKGTKASSGETPPRGKEHHS